MPTSLPPYQPAGKHRPADADSARRAQEYRAQQQIEEKRRREACERADRGVAPQNLRNQQAQVAGRSQAQLPEGATR